MSDYNWNREALQNIIKNAIEHSRHKGTVKINITDNDVYTAVYITNSFNFCYNLKITYRFFYNLLIEMFSLLNSTTPASILDSLSIDTIIQLIPLT